MLLRHLRNKVLRLDIDRKDSIDLVLLDIAQAAKVLDARVAHDNIDPSELLLRPLKELRQLLLLRHIGLDGDGFDAERACLLCNLFGARG